MIIENWHRSGSRNRNTTTPYMTSVGRSEQSEAPISITFADAQPITHGPFTITKYRYLALRMTREEALDLAKRITEYASK